MIRAGGAATDLTFKAEIYSYSRSRGIFAGVALDGAALAVDNESNKAFYNTAGINANEIFTNKSLKAPGVAEEFKKTLTKYSQK
jgi:lipid-binding SYLF domain-containing protein